MDRELLNAEVEDKSTFFSSDSVNVKITIICF